MMSMNCTSSLNSWSLNIHEWHGVLPSQGHRKGNSIVHATFPMNMVVCHHSLEGKCCFLHFYIILLTNEIPNDDLYDMTCYFKGIVRPLSKNRTTPKLVFLKLYCHPSESTHPNYRNMVKIAKIFGVHCSSLLSRTHFLLEKYPVWQFTFSLSVYVPIGKLLQHLVKWISVLDTWFQKSMLISEIFFFFFLH